MPSSPAPCSAPVPPGNPDPPATPFTPITTRYRATAPTTPPTPTQTINKPSALYPSFQSPAINFVLPPTNSSIT